MKKLIFIFSIFVLSAGLFASPFNKNLSASDEKTLNEGKVLIKNIGTFKKACLASGTNSLGDYLLTEIKNLSPKYLAEVIQIRPYKGNEDLPEKLEAILNNVPDYAGIPYWSERHQRYYDLYSSAVITSKSQTDYQTFIKADIDMDPFGVIKQDITLTKTSKSVLYVSTNLNTMNYQGKFDCVKPGKMKMCIYLFRDGNNWVLYGIGGVNAMRVPFLTERIETSFINRIKTFCNFIFTKI